MNKKQKTVVLVMALAIVAMMLFPPFYRIYYGHKVNAGYGFIMLPHAPYDLVNVWVLSMQFFVALIFGAALFLFFKDSE